LVPRRRDPLGKVLAVHAFNASLGDPQRSFRSVQVAGTSGKGSTAYYLARLLQSHGFKTGLHVSPYLQVATEKTWIDGRYVDGQAFYEATERLRPVSEAYRRDEGCPASVHGMTSLGVTYELFRSQEVQWGVMETGLGGRFDLVQGLDRRLSVITDIGFDHMETLGHTLPEIAWHKAGIMAGSPVCVAVYRPEVWDVYEKEAKRQKCRLVKLDVGESGSEFAAGRELGVLGLEEETGGVARKGFVARNMEVALRAMRVLCEAEGFQMEPDACREALLGARFPGRMERVQDDGVEVVFDAAHNEQKMRGLRSALGEERSKEWVMLLGATGSRDVLDMLGHLGMMPSAAVVSRPHLYAKRTSEPKEVAMALRGTVSRVEALDEPAEAMSAAVEMARRLGIGRVLVTGSLYLVGQARSHYYPWQDVLLQRTSFPMVGEGQ